MPSRSAALPRALASRLVTRRLLQFRRSPNSIKVRIALNVKGLDYEATEMSSADRQPMIEAAGWPLVPILIDDRVVMRDSAAILHYLEANYREGPSLTPTDRDELRNAERIVTVVNSEILPIQWSLLSEIQKPEEERDPARGAEARRAAVAALSRLEERLATREWLVGDTMSLYDVILGANLLPLRAPAEFVEQSPMWGYFTENLRIEEERPHVSAWVGRVVAHDGLA
jgi:glutathione S-transferase